MAILSFAHNLSPSAKTTNQLVGTEFDGVTDARAAAVNIQRAGGIIALRLARVSMFKFLSDEGESWLSCLNSCARDSTFCESSLSDKALHVQRE